MNEAAACWVVTDGKQGMENQALGLAEALGLPPTLKHVRLRTPWRQVSPYVRFLLSRAAGGDGDRLGPPWPEVLISCGRASIAPSLAARRAAAGGLFLIHVGDPVIGLRHFDLIVSPRHDRARGDNVILTDGSLHRITAARLSDAAGRLGAPLLDLPRPRVAVLIGGTSRLHRLTAGRTAEIADALAQLARQGCGLMVTASRRTGTANEALLRARLAGLAGAFWDGTGENPYFAYLATADAILVTEDSVNMLTEAAATGRPVHTLALAGGSPKFDAFHRAMRRAGVTRPFTGTLESWTYPPRNEMPAVARAVAARLARAGVPLPPCPAADPAFAEPQARRRPAAGDS